MYFQQSDLFSGMDRDFVKRVMDISEKGSFEDGTILFREGEPAHSFYVLLKGNVKLDVADTGQVHLVSHPGEAFGWSSLVQRDTYSASAITLGETKLLQFNRHSLEAIIDQDPANGVIFFRRLARTLGQRLTLTYSMISGHSRASTTASYGSTRLSESHLEA